MKRPRYFDSDRIAASCSIAQSFRHSSHPTILSYKPWRDRRSISCEATSVSRRPLRAKSAGAIHFMRRTGGDVLPWYLSQYVKIVAYAISSFLSSTPIYFGRCWQLPSISTFRLNFSQHTPICRPYLVLWFRTEKYIYKNDIFRFPLEPTGGPCVGSFSQPWRFWTTSLLSIYCRSRSSISRYSRPHVYINRTWPSVPAKLEFPSQLLGTYGQEKEGTRGL